MSQLISQPAKPAQAPEASAKVRRKPNLRLLIPIGLIVIGAVSFSAWYFSSRPRTDALQLSGRIEGYPTNVGAKVGGRIEYVAISTSSNCKP